MNWLSDFWRTLQAADKHLDDRRAWGRFIHAEIISRIRGPIRRVIDYGCGGGWVSMHFPADAEIILVDIDPGVLTTAERRLRRTGHGKVGMILLDGEPSKKPFASLSGAVDVLVCTMVIPHFPGCEYFEGVVGAWKAIGPQYIALSTRWAPKTAGRSDEAEYKTRYGQGLLLASDDVRELFAAAGYDELYHFREAGAVKRWGTEGYEYWLFARTPGSGA